MTPDDPPADDLLPDDWDEIADGEIRIAGIKFPENHHEAESQATERLLALLGQV